MPNWDDWTFRRERVQPVQPVQPPLVAGRGRTAMMNRNPILNRGMAEAGVHQSINERQRRLESTLVAQVTALMMNAQRYEMRYATALAMNDMDEARTARAASDDFAAHAFSIINIVIGDLPAVAAGQPLTREQAFAEEFPDVASRRPRNPEMPDVDDDPSEVDNVVGPEGVLLFKTGEQDV